MTDRQAGKVPVDSRHDPNTEYQATDEVGRMPAHKKPKAERRYGPKTVRRGK